jgi:hypothetical protein
MNITLDDATRIANKLGSNVSPHRLLIGMKTEYYNNQNLDLEELAKITLVHLEENPGRVGFGDYYHNLDKHSNKYINISAYDIVMVTDFS